MKIYTNDLVKGHSDFKVKSLTFGLYTQVSDSGPLGPLVSNLRISGCQLKTTILYHLFCCLRQFLPLYRHFSEQTVLTLSSDAEGAAF